MAAISFATQAEHVVAGAACALALAALCHGGTGELLELVRASLHSVPGVAALLRRCVLWHHRRRPGLRPDDMTLAPARDEQAIPETGISVREMQAELQRMMEQPASAAVGGGVVGEESAGQSSSAVAAAAIHVGAAHRGSNELERMVVAMTASMLSGAGAVGLVTSGGTESITVSLKAHRDWARARHPGQRRMEVLAPITVHPAFEKAAQLFDLIMVHVPVDENMRVNVEAYRAAITADTILLVASAPQYCHSVVDPIEALSKLAVEFQLPLHVDACFGGFMLPWVEKLGHPVPPFDFRIPGVTSISADVHKYGFSIKGASVLLFRSPAIRKHAVFADAEWPGGLYAQALLNGPRPGAVLAAAWAAIVTAGQQGFLARATVAMETVQYLKARIAAIPSLRLVGQPSMTSFAIASTSADVDILAVADAMEQRGWKIERQQLPSCLHFSIMPHHTQSRKQLANDLAEAVEAVRGKPELSQQGRAAMYGMVARVPDKGLVSEYLVEMMNSLYTLKPNSAASG